MIASAAPAPLRVTRSPMSYEEYLALPDDGRIVEWVDGETICYMPTTPAHQFVVIFLIRLLGDYVQLLSLGHVLAAPIEVKLWPGGPSREPDVLFFGQGKLAQLTEKRFEGAPDLVVEVVSAGSATIDRVEKFLEYEQAGVGEYWLIDPRPRKHQADFYVRNENGRFAEADIEPDGVYQSRLIPGLRLRIDWLWQPESVNVVRILAELLAEAPSLSDEQQAGYREMARLLSKQ
jgi:Uma2 family endonuclease